MKELGRGSYGKVFLAKSTIGPIDYVAVKVAPMERSSSLELEKDILQHLRGCSEIVQCIGSEMTSVCYYLILEYAGGGTLAELIRKQKKLTESKVKEYLRMILRGLSCIHRRGFVHADLKPANILAFPRPNGKMKLKIADFGLSKRWVVGQDEAAEHSEPRFRGTARYMSPESIIFGKISPPLDIWSLGCIFIEMITGSPVWNSCRTYDQLLKKLVNETELPTDVLKKLSKEGRDFLASCLDRDSKRRWTADMLLKHPYLSEENSCRPEFERELASLSRSLSYIYTCNYGY